MCTQCPIWAFSLIGLVLSLDTPAPPQTVQGQTQQPTLAPVSPAPTNLERLPPNPPTLIYENGFLIISAHNSTLGDILRGIRGLTGADMVVPPQADERVFVRLGPALPRDILRSLLTGSRFSYLIVASDTNPNALARVVLFPKSAVENTPQTSLSVADRAPESNIVQGLFQEPQEGELPVRAQQRMLQQRRQMIMQELRQDQQPE